MKFTKLFALAAILGVAASANAAYLLEIDTDGADDGVLTFNSNFALGTVLLPQPDDPVSGDPVPPAPGVMSVSQSIASTAVGLTGGDSIFGGTAASTIGFPNPDTYLYFYTPGVDGDNFQPGQSTLLNEFGDRIGANVAGDSGLYEIYVAWPDTANISFGNPTDYVVNDGTSDVLVTQISQDNDDGGFIGNQWISLGQVFMDAGTTYTITQTNEPEQQVSLSGTTFTNGFVSMRAAGMLFVRVPEPTSALLLALAGLSLAARRR